MHELTTEQAVDGETFLSIPSDKDSLVAALGCSLTLGGGNKLCRLLKETSAINKGVLPYFIP